MINHLCMMVRIGDAPVGGLKEKHEKDESKAAEAGYGSETDSPNSDECEVYDQDETEWDLDGNGRANEATVIQGVRGFTEEPNRSSENE